jgi:hypothetical protein
LPWACTEIACGNGADDNANGLTDCADPSCEGQECTDTNACSFNERCSAGSCRPATTITCNSPPGGPCWLPQGTCNLDQSCTYSVNYSGTCPNQGDVCRPGGTCAPPPGEAFGYPIANVDPVVMLPRPPPGTVNLSGSVTFDSTTNTFGGTWNIRPTAVPLTTSTGPAVALLATDLVLNPGTVLRLTGDKPIIFISYTSIILFSATIDASGHGQVPGPGGNVNCGTSAGGNGAAGSSTAAGAGGAGGAKSAGGPGGGGSTFGTGGIAGTQRSRSRLALVGGCPGGTGGGPQGALGGAGGGAIQFVGRYGFAADDSRVLVNGAGGLGARSIAQMGPGGGGGGGSGGSIVIQAPIVAVSRSVLVSNGGGGGEGGGIIDLGFVFGGGRDGADGNVNPGYFGAAGGSGGSFNGGNGGNGAAQFSSAGAGFPGTTYNDIDGNSFYQAGGGGGGGASGAVVVDVPMSTAAQISRCQIGGNTVLSPDRDVPAMCTL